MNEVETLKKMIDQWDNDHWQERIKRGDDYNKGFEDALDLVYRLIKKLHERHSRPRNRGHQEAEGVW